MIAYKLFAYDEKESLDIQKAAILIGYNWGVVLPFQPRKSKSGFVYLFPNGKIELAYSVTKFKECPFFYIHSNIFLQMVEESREEK